MLGTDKIIKAIKLMFLNVILFTPSFTLAQTTDGIITQKQFDEWMNNLKSLPTSNIDDLPKKYKGLFNFKFDCLKSEI
jgi:hypothetical protein